MARSRQSVARSTVASSQHDTSTFMPPIYESLLYPLDSERKIKVQQLARSNEFADLDNMLKAAATTLSECALDINELAATRSAKKEPSSQQAVSSDDDLRAFLNSVSETSSQIEKSVRATIDEMREVQNLREALKAVDMVHVQGGQNRLLQTRSAARGALSVNVIDDDDDDMLGTEITAPGATADDTVGPGPGPKAVFDDALQAERQKYDLISMHNRYAEMPQYIDFKRHEWEGKHSGVPEEEAPQLPHSRHWFTERGSPAPGAAPDADDSDDDIQTLKVKLSTKCPILLTEMKEPICNRKCQHVYEKEAIEQHINSVIRPTGRGPPRAAGAECAVPGCDKIIGLKDLFIDKLMKRKIERVRLAREQESGTARNRQNAQNVDDDGFNAVDDDQEEEVEEDDDTEMSDLQASTLQPKAEPRSSRRQSER